MRSNLEKRLAALEKRLAAAPVTAHLADGRVIRMQGRDPSMRLLRAALGNGSAEDEEILRDAVNFEEGDGRLCELASAIYQSGESDELRTQN